MECPVCSRDLSARLPFRCTACVRNELYRPRLKNVEALLQKESLGRQVEAIAAKARSSPPDSQRKSEDVNKSDDASRRWKIEHTLAAKEQSTQRTHAILEHVEALKKEMEEVRADISKRKCVNAQRRSDTDGAKNQLSERRAAVLSGIEKSMKRTDHLWGSIHARTTDARSFLCYEAATLYNLRRRKRRKGGVVREEYAIGAVSIVDLRDMNSKLDLSSLMMDIRP
jgi:hypothetical protein